MTVALADWLVTVREAATFVGVVAAMLVGVGAVAKLPWVNRPGAWLWRHLIAEPFAGWLDGVIAPHIEPLCQRLEGVEHEVRTNDGSSLRDVADRVEKGQERLGTQVAVLAAGVDVIRAECAGIRSTEVSIAGTVGDIARNTSTDRRDTDRE